MPPAVNAKHILGLDILRFVAACLVVAFHYCFLMGINPEGLVGSASRGVVKFPELYESTNFGWVGVQIFFVISGFVIAFSGEKSSAFSFLRSRIVRLGPAVWICAPITLLATILVGFRQHEDMYRAFRHSLAFLPWAPWIDGSYWTLGIEISFYAAVLFLIKFFKFENIKILAIVIGVVSSMFWAIHALAGIEQIHSFGLQLKWVLEDRLPKLLLINHGMFFALGVFLWSELIKKHDVKNIFWIILFCMSGCAQIVAESDIVNHEFNTRYSAAIPCAVWLASIAIIVLSVRANARLHRLSGGAVKAIQIAGMMTYPLYLLHQIVGGTMMGWMVLNGADRWVALATVSIIIFVLTGLIATWAEPWIQGWTKYLINYIHGRYNSMRIRLVK